MPRRRAIHSETAYEAAALLSSLIGEIMEAAAGTAVLRPLRTATALAKRERILRVAADDVCALSAAFSVAARLAVRTSEDN
jgi:hypothetical protein